MSIFRVISSSNYAINTLQEILTYVTRVTGTRTDLIYGAYVSPFDPCTQMLFVKEVYAQENGKAFYHFVFNPEEDISVETAYAIGVEMANAIANFGGNRRRVAALSFRL